MIGFARGQLDYVFFICGLGSVLLAVVCFYLRKSGSSRLPWVWLSLFAVTHAAVEWLNLLCLALGDNLALDAARTSIKIFSLVCLVEFARGGMAGVRGRGPGRRIFIPLLLLCALGGIEGARALDAASQYLIAVPGGMCAAVVLLLESRNATGLARRSLAATGMAFAVYTLAAGASLSEAGLVLPLGLDQGTFADPVGFCIHLLCGVSTVWAAVAMWVHFQVLRRAAMGQDAAPDMSCFAAASLAGIVLAGWAVTVVLGNKGDVEMRENLLSRSTTAASCIDPARVIALEGSSADLGKSSYKYLRYQLQAIRAANADCRYVYLMSRRDGKVVFLVDAEPMNSEDFSPPGQVYTDSSPKLLRSLKDGRPFVEGPVADSWGSWVSGGSGVRHPATNGVVAIVGMDIDAAGWQRNVAIYRLFGIGLTLFLALLVATFFWVLYRAKECSARTTASERRFRNLVENTNDWVWETDADLVYTYASPRIRDLLGYEPEQVVGKTPFDLMAPDDAEQIAGVVMQILAKHEPFIFLENTLLHKDGRIVIVETNGKPVIDDRGVCRGYRGIDRDVTEHKRVERDLRIQTSAINAASDQIIITDKAGNIEFVNPSFERETGYRSDEVVGKNPRVLKSGRQGPAFYEDMWKTILSGQTWHGEIVNQHKDRSTVVEDMTVTPVKSDTGVIERFVAIKRNITEKKAYEQQLDHLAHHDPLTGLPNRLLFSDRLTQSLAQARRDEKLLAVMFLDLDRFKQINDTFGHDIGDQLLKAAADRLRGCLRETDTLSRMGGDEFTLILGGVRQALDAAKVAGNVLDALSKPFVLQGHELSVTASIGISIYPADGADVETLVRNADTAMYRAKEQGRSNYQLYTEALNTVAMQKMSLENSLRGALERDELVVHFQPQVEIATGKTRGAEVLVRWRHPDLGLVPPAQFIPLAEETGLISTIDEWVLRTACEQAKAWQDRGFAPMNIAVNVSGRQFQQGDLVDTVRKALEETGFDARCLEMELTESSLMQDPDRAVETLRSLKALGARISIDDFGTGYSTLSYLKCFPVDVVKIDRSFIKDITSDTGDTAVAAAVIAMAHSLNLTVVAKGVETLDQLKSLLSLSCDQVQGYFISQPMPSEDFAHYLRRASRPGEDGLLPAA